MSLGLVWFRNDLRIADNEAIFKAINENEKVVFFYCLDDFWLGKTKYGFDKIGGYRLKFLVETIEDLRENFKSKGCELVISIGNTAERLSELYEIYNFDNLYVQEEMTSEEIKIETKVIAELSKKSAEINKKVKLHKIWGLTLIHLKDLNFSFDPTSKNTLPDIFTNFRINVEKYSKPQNLINSEKLDLAFKNQTINLQLNKNFDWNEIKEKLSIRFKTQSPKSALIFEGGESKALNRLKNYFYDTNSIWVYKNTRNGLIGQNYSSKFSPYLAIGAISAKQIYWELKSYEESYGSNISTYWLYFELLWRDYFKFVAYKYGDKIFKYNGLRNKKLKLSSDMNLAKVWLDGNTKEKFVNANMIELNESGWMSNRGRQNVASYLVHDLGIDWRIGAEYFESLLLDYDVTSNWCNWQYIAGVGNDPRENRKFNIQLQQEKYDKNQKYIKHWLGNNMDSLF